MLTLRHRTHDSPLRFPTPSGLPQVLETNIEVLLCSRLVQGHIPANIVFVFTFQKARTVTMLGSASVCEPRTDQTKVNQIETASMSVSSPDLDWNVNPLKRSGNNMF